MNGVSPGQAYLLPHGQRIYNKMIDLMRDEYYERDFLEVSTPTIYATELFEVSGHVCHYKQNMFFLNDSHAHSDEEVVVDNKEADSINQDQIELPTDPTAIESITEPIAESKKTKKEHSQSLSAMNCPSHCLIYKSEIRSYADLPLRLASFAPS